MGRCSILPPKHPQTLDDPSIKLAKLYKCSINKIVY